MGGETNSPDPDRSRRIALLLEYDGTRYAGSQFQVNAPTVQGELETAILKTTGETARAAFAGRTDAGVHAYGQVAAFSTASELTTATLLNALNAWLPRDIVVKAIGEVGPRFDPRRQAVRRRYLYVVENAPVRPAIGRQYSWHLPAALNEVEMDAAATSLIGEHDFAAFAGPPEDPAASTVRLLHEFHVMHEGTKYLFEVSANAFLRGQVRRMVGALLQVGAGKFTAAEYGRLLDGPPSSAGPAAPPRGLTLVRVDYSPPLFTWA